MSGIPSKGKKTPRNEVQETSDVEFEEEMRNLVLAKLRNMADKIIREEIEKEIENKLSRKKISVARRTRIYKKVIKEVTKNVPKLLEEIVEEQLKRKEGKSEDRRVSEDVEKDIAEKIRSFVQRSMDKAIADEIFQKVKIEKRTQIPTVEPKLGIIGVRHGQVLMVFIFLAISYIQRMDLPIAIIAMTNKKQANSNQDFLEFSWNGFIKSLVLSAFYWGYLLLQIPGGIVSEKFGSKSVMSFSMFLCSTITLFIPLATILGNWIGLYVMKVLQGFCQATFIPAVYVFTSHWIPPKEKSKLFTPAFGGMQFGVVSFLPIAGLLCASPVGWPSVFFFSAVVGYMWVLVWIFVAANSPAVHRSISREEQFFIEGSYGFGEITIKGVEKHIPWKPILTSVPFWALMAAHFGENWGYFTILSYGPTYISSVLNIDIQENTLYTSLAFFIGWILIVIFGFVSSYISSQTIHQLEIERKLWNSFGFYCGGILFIILGMSHTTRAVVALPLLMGIIGTNSAVYNGFFSNHADLSPNYIGILMGLTNTFGSLAIVLAILFVGKMVSNFHWAEVFITAGVIMIFCNTIFVIFGSSEIQPWNTPQNLHLHLEEGVDLTDTTSDSPKKIRLRKSV